MPGSPVRSFSIRFFAVPPCLLIPAFLRDGLKVPKQTEFFRLPGRASGRVSSRSSEREEAAFPIAQNHSFFCTGRQEAQDFYPTRGARPVHFWRSLYPDENISRRNPIQFRFSIRITEPMRTAEALLFSAPGIRSTATRSLGSPQLTANAPNLPNTAFCKNAPSCFQTAQKICADWRII